MPAQPQAWRAHPRFRCPTDGASVDLRPGRSRPGSPRRRSCGCRGRATPRPGCSRRARPRAEACVGADLLAPAGRGGLDDNARDAWHRGAEHRRPAASARGRRTPERGARPRSEDHRQPGGRWPANLVLSHGAHAPKRDASRTARSGCSASATASSTPRRRPAGSGGRLRGAAPPVVQTFKIGEHNEQLCEANPVANVHPTVKPPADALARAADHAARRARLGPVHRLRQHRRRRCPRGRALPRDRARGDYVPIARARITHWAATAPCLRHRSSEVRAGHDARPRGHRADRRRRR